MRQRQIHEWQDQLDCTRATNGDPRRELLQLVRSTPSIAWTAAPPMLRVSLPPLATAIMAALLLWPAGRPPLSANDDYTIGLWDARTHKQLGTLTGHTGPINRVTFSPDARTLVSISEDETVRLWDARTHKQLDELQLSDARSVVGVALSADRRKLAFASEDGTLRLWDARAHKQRQLSATLKAHAGSVTSLMFSPDGRRLVSSGVDGTVRVWSARNGKQIATVPLTRAHPAVSVAFTADGQRLVLRSEDGTVLLWDTRTHNQLPAPQANSQGGVGAALSPDGRTVASIKFDGTARSEKILWHKVAWLAQNAPREP